METNVLTTERFRFDLQECIKIAQGMTLANPKEVMLKYIEQNYKGGEIVPIKIPENAVGANLIIRNIDRTYVGTDKDVKCESDEDSLVAIGRLNKDTDWDNPDPYETAGGYIKGIALKDTIVKIYLGYDYTGFFFHYKCDVNITLDHYNNNFFGKSTGNGTKKYEIGDRVERKLLQRDKNKKLDTTLVSIKKIDVAKIKDIIYNTK